MLSGDCEGGWFGNATSQPPPPMVRQSHRCLPTTSSTLRSWREWCQTSWADTLDYVSAGDSTKWEFGAWVVIETVFSFCGWAMLGGLWDVLDRREVGLQTVVSDRCDFDGMCSAWPTMHGRCACQVSPYSGWLCWWSWFGFFDVFWSWSGFLLQATLRGLSSGGCWSRIYRTGNRQCSGNCCTPGLQA